MNQNKVNAKYLVVGLISEIFRDYSVTVDGDAVKIMDAKVYVIATGAKEVFYVSSDPEGSTGEAVQVDLRADHFETILKGFLISLDPRLQKTPPKPSAPIRPRVPEEIPWKWPGPMYPVTPPLYEPGVPGTPIWVSTDGTGTDSTINQMVDIHKYNS